MAGTKRQEILAFVKQTIEENFQALESVQINHATSVDLETAPFPAGFISSGEENRVDSGGGIDEETWDWDIMIEIWAQGSDVDMEEMLQDLHNAMGVDVTLGGFADYSFRKGSSPFFIIDPNKEMKGFGVAYGVRYHHPLGVM